ncbi:kinesin-like protein Klp61F [Toxorhynchites rutilus septentrionalis]|uniref:kinesin-like protein Klp61F n=1 Tax=Toxorhynchites rutilus septentrionalis TaxID=329112 RepID=UPI00247A7282|nr:kinesin-like protein Klp61F [Toxorhynchites rutilus septentrionalis]
MSNMNASNGIDTSNGKSLKCNQNVQVYLRVRPTNTREKLIRSQQIVEVISHHELLLKPIFLDSRNSKKFTFDRAFDVYSKQPEVYHAVVAPYIEEVLSGFNCTVFAYGQTGTGKTYTMVGEEQPELSAGWEDDTKTGIIPRAVNHLFDELRMTELEFSMRISYLELYNEELCDLLSTDDTVKIRIYDDVNKKGSVIVQGLEEIPVHSKDDVYKLLGKGQERRRTASTLMNAQSSRSHTIFSIIVHIKENGIDGEELLKIGKLNLVDLAGSENITKAGNEKGIRTRETVNINQSLLTLGRVITALVERTPHIPYRESKLTRLLQESLGGRTKTSIIATISPGHKDFEETMSTLEYAHRAKNIQNKPEANQKLSKKTVIKEYTEEIDRLKRELTATRDKNGIYLPEETYNEMLYKSEATTKELNDKVVLIKLLKEDLAKKETIFKEVSLHLFEKEEQLRKVEDNLVNTKHELTTSKRYLNKTKRRYTEKKVILEHHMKTENKLTNHAKELMKVVDTVQSDTEGLHSTIDRRKATDEENQTVCERFVEQLKNRLTVMQGSVSELTHSSFQISNSITSDWDNYVANQECRQQNTLKQITALESYSQSMLSKGSTLVSTFRDDHLNWNSEQLKAVQSFAEIINNVNESLRTTLAANIQSLRKTLTEQYEQQRQMLDATLKANQEFHKQSLQCCLEQKSGLRDMDQLIVQFEDSQSQIVNFVKTKKLSNQARMKRLKEFYDAMSDELRSEEANLNSLETVIQKLGNTKDSARVLIRTSDAIVDRTIECQNASANCMQNSRQQLESIAQEHLSVAQGQLHHNVVHTVETLSNQLKDTVAQQNSALASAEDYSRKQWQQFGSQFEQNQSEFTSSLQTRLQSLNHSLGLEHVANSDLRSTTLSLNKQLQRNITSYQSQTNANLTELTDQVNRFHQEELSLYQPTGQTPVRKTISYARDLATTSPHDRIVRRFWRERGMMDQDTSITIQEDNEEVSVLYNSLHGDEVRNSTPLASRCNVFEEDRERFKELQISNILTKMGNDVEWEDNKENMDTINESA